MKKTSNFSPKFPRAKMVYCKTYLPGSPGRTVSPDLTELAHFKHILGYWKGSEKLRSRRDLAGEVLRVAVQRSFRPVTPGAPPRAWKVLSDRWCDDANARNHRNIRTQSPMIFLHSPKLTESQSPVFKAVTNSEEFLRGKLSGISRSHLRVRSPKQNIYSPLIRRSTSYETLKLNPSTPQLQLANGKENPRNSGRIHKPTCRPKKSVHWKTNIATWIQLTAMNSSQSMSEVSNSGDKWNRRGDNLKNEKENESSDDDGTMRFNTAGKSICEGSSTKEDDSSDFEYTDFGNPNNEKRGATRVYFNPYTGSNVDSANSNVPSFCSSLFPNLRKPLPLPPVSEPHPDYLDSNYYSELNCSCGCQESIYSMHTYEDVEDSFGNDSLSDSDTKQLRHGSINSSSSSSNSSSTWSNHTYCEIGQVGRGSKPEVLGSLFRNDRHLEALKSTLVHLLPKDDIISTTLLACRLGDLEYLQDLAKQSRMDARAHDLQGATCMHYAARGDHIHILRFLLEDQGEREVMRCDVGATPLHDAAALGHLESIKFLNKYSKHSLDLSDMDGATVLHVAARNLLIVERRDQRAAAHPPYWRGMNANTSVLAFAFPLETFGAVERGEPAALVTASPYQPTLALRPGEATPDRQPERNTIVS